MIAWRYLRTTVDGYVLTLGRFGNFGFEVEPTIGLVQGLPPLRCRFGSDQISNALSCRQVHLAM